MKRFFGILWCGLALLAAPGCDSGGDDDDGIRGTWEISGPDEWYATITSNTITSNDFQGDSVDEGDDCYARESFALESLGENQYRITAAGSSSTIEIRRSGENLIIDGDTWSRSSKTSFTPVC